VGLDWPGVSGATKYRYRWETAGRVSPWAETTATLARPTWRFARGTRFTAVVQAGNRYGWSASRRGNATTAR
jgi:hypothetical protein